MLGNFWVKMALVAALGVFLTSVGLDIHHAWVKHEQYVYQQGYDKANDEAKTREADQLADYNRRYAAAIALKDAEEATMKADQLERIHVAEHAAAMRAADVTAVASERDRVRRDLAATIAAAASRSAAGAPSEPGGQCASALEAARMSADLFGGVSALASVYSSFADAAYAASGQCVGAYEDDGVKP